MTRKTPPPPPKKSTAATRAATRAAARRRKVKSPEWVVHVLECVDDKGKLTKVRVKRWTGPRHPLVPEIDPHYVFRTELARELAWAIWPHDDGAPTTMLLTGDKGAGKTSLVVQMAAHCNIGVQRINLNVGTTTRHLKGRVGAQDGSTKFIPGVATMAMEQGLWLLLDEMSGATPPVALALFPILEPEGAVMLEDAQPPRYVERHQDFRAFATDNTIGADQEESRFNYSGTNPEVNEALLDRIGSTMHVPYMSRELEFEMIRARIPSMDDDVLEGIIRIAGNIRESQQIGTSFSTRNTIEWSRRYAAGKIDASGKVTDREYTEVLDIAYPAFLNKMRSRMERDAVVEVIRRIFKLGA